MGRLRTAGIAAVIAGALAGGCHKGEKQVTISPTCIMVEEAASRDGILTNHLEWCGDRGELTYYNEDDRRVTLYATGSLTDPQVNELYRSFTVDLTRDTPQTRALAEKARLKWMEFCNRVGCADLEERQRNGQYQYEIDL